jgi:hypothetical protein
MFISKNLFNIKACSRIKNLFNIKALSRVIFELIFTIKHQSVVSVRNKTVVRQENRDT